MDDMAHEFLLVSIKRQLDQVNDPDQLRTACLSLIDLIERQKSMFRELLYDTLERQTEGQESCE